jgi:hypothetical protein
MTSDKEEQALRLAILHNDRLVREKAAQDKRASTYLAHALVDAEAIGGRFAAAAVGRSAVVGSTAVPNYPRLPESSPWAQPNPFNQPEALGYDINWVEPMGEPFEQIEAQRILDERSASAAPPADGSSTDVPVSLAVERAELPTHSSALSGPATAATGEPVTQVLMAGSPTPSQSSAALRTTLTTRAPASNDEVQRGAGARLPFPRRL